MGWGKRGEGRGEGEERRGESTRIISLLIPNRVAGYVLRLLLLLLGLLEHLLEELELGGCEGWEQEGYKENCEEGGKGGEGGHFWRFRFGNEIEFARVQSC